MSWTPPGHNGGSKISFYTLEVAQAAPCTCGQCPSAAAAASDLPRLQQQQQQPCEAALNETNSAQMTFAGETLSAEIRDLQPGTPYFFRVAANNAQVRTLEITMELKDSL